MRPLRITREHQIEFARFNVGTESARNEYAKTPIASCPYDDCYELLEFGERVCSEHWRLLTEARDRMRRARGRAS